MARAVVIAGIVWDGVWGTREFGATYNHLGTVVYGSGLSGAASFEEFRLAGRSP